MYKKLFPLILSLLSLSLIFTFLSCDKQDIIITGEKAYPTPFSPHDSEEVTMELKIKSSLNIQDLQVNVVIYNFNKKRVWTFQRIVSGTPLTEVNVQWGGQNDNGATVSPGIYKAKIIVEILETTSGEVGGNTDTVELNLVVE